MTLTDPREALAEQSHFIGYLVGLAGLGQVIRALADDRHHRAGGSHDPDDFVHALLGLASVGGAIERIAISTPAQVNPIDSATAVATTRWLR